MTKEQLKNLANRIPPFPLWDHPSMDIYDLYSDMPEMTEAEKTKMYMRCEKTDLIKMLIQANRYLERRKAEIQKSKNTESNG